MRLGIERSVRKILQFSSVYLAWALDGGPRINCGSHAFFGFPAGGPSHDNCRGPFPCARPGFHGVEWAFFAKNLAGRNRTSYQLMKGFASWSALQTSVVVVVVAVVVVVVAVLCFFLYYFCCCFGWRCCHLITWTSDEEGLGNVEARQRVEQLEASTHRELFFLVGKFLGGWKMNFLLGWLIFRGF